MSGGDESDESDEELTRTNQPQENSNESEENKKENRKKYREKFLKLRDDIRHYIKRYPQTSRDDLLDKIFNDRIKNVHELKDTLRPEIEYDTFIYHLLFGINFTNIDEAQPQAEAEQEAAEAEGGGKKRRRKKQSKRRSKKHKSKKYKSRRGRKTRRR